MAKKKADETRETDVTVRASPETQVTVEASGSSRRGSGGGGASATVLQAIRENPVPAGMIWAGLGWLALSAAGARRPQTGAQEAVAGVATTTQATVTQVARGVQQRVSALVGRARGVISTGGTVATAAASSARERAEAEARRGRETLVRVATEKPEVVEIAAVAAGAAVALALPATQPERQALAPRRDEILRKLDEVGEQAVGKLEQVVAQPQA